MLMSMILERYVKPNANAQFRHLTKLKLWSIYSQIYGSMPALIDYTISDHYVGPDFQLIPIRQWYPQPGIFQIQDMDYTYVDSFVTYDFLESKLKDEQWDKKNVQALLDLAKDKEGRKEYLYPTYAENKWAGEATTGKGKFASFLLRTRYERDRWVTYCPDFKAAGALRDIDNPHKNDKLPIIVKETIPLLDRSTGLGDIERGAPIQKALDTVVNLSLDTAKITVFPPTIVNKLGIVPSSIKFEPLAIWEEIIPNSIRTHQISPAGINNFNNYTGYLTATMNNLLGTTDFSANSNAEAPTGRTPAAVRYMAAKESAADSWERQSMEEAIEELYDRFVELVSSIQPKPIDLQLFEGEINQIATAYPDIKDMLSDKGKLRIKPDVLKGQYKFYVNSGSTVVKDAVAQNQAVSSIFALLAGNPELLVELQKKGKTIDFSALVQAFVSTSGMDNVDKIVVDYTPPPPVAPPAQAGTLPMQGPPQQGPPMPPQGQMPQQPMPPQSVMPNGQMPQFQDPQIRELAQQLFQNK
jgi:hypothetical protein